MRTALFWVITKRVVVIPYRRVMTTYRSHLQGSTLIDTESLLNLEVETDKLCRNVGDELPLLAV